MANTFVSFISDDRFEECVKFLLDKADEGRIKAQKLPERNVIDPFAALFSMAAFDLAPHDWTQNEEFRQAGKSLENALGDFHQKLLGSIDGWQCLKTGGQVDVLCPLMKIIAEIKNKHNTVKASDKITIYRKLDSLVNLKESGYKDFIAYYVVIIPSQPTRFDREFTPPDSARGDKAPAKLNVREIDGNTFYETATGRENALREIFDAIPHAIESIYRKSENNKNDLSQIKNQYQHALGYFNRAFDK